jgi:predicted nucleic acid-binding protein
MKIVLAPNALKDSLSATQAALAMEHGATLCTCDRHFTRFTGLRTLNPLV